MITKEQRLARMSGIGGSDIAAICDANPYKTRHQIWLEKVSPSLVEEEDNMNIKVGNALEDVIAKKYFQDRKRKEYDKLFDLIEADTIYHPEYPFLFANVDRLLFDSSIPLENDLPKYAVLEVKTAISYNSQKQWKQGIPEFHRYQLAWYALITDAPYVDVAVLCIGEKEPRYYRYERNPSFEEFILEKAKDFWLNYVVPKKDPDEDKSFFYQEEVQKPSSGESGVVINPQLESSLKTIQELSTYIDCLQAEKDALIDKLKDFCGEAHFLVDESGKRLVSFKDQSRTYFDSVKFKQENPEAYEKYKKTSTSRVFRLSHPTKEDF